MRVYESAIASVVDWMAARSDVSTAEAPECFSSSRVVAFLPLALSLIGLTIVLVHAAVFDTVYEAAYLLDTISPHVFGL